jgi:hypothetical protein
MVMDRTYEVFLGGATKPARETLHVTINNQNVIVMNSNCYRLMGEPAAVRLAYSREYDRIALSPCDERLPEAFPVRPKDPKTRRVNAAPFCRHFRIHIDTTLRFLEPEISLDATLHLDLRKVVNVAQVRGKRKKPA